MTHLCGAFEIPPRWYFASLGFRGCFASICGILSLFFCLTLFHLSTAISIERKFPVIHQPTKLHYSWPLTAVTPEWFSKSERDSIFSVATHPESNERISERLSHEQKGKIRNEACHFSGSLRPCRNSERFKWVLSVCQRNLTPLSNPHMLCSLKVLKFRWAPPKEYICA